jgi:hypothetical protein
MGFVLEPPSIDSGPEPVVLADYPGMMFYDSRELAEAASPRLDSTVALNAAIQAAKTAGVKIVAPAGKFIWRTDTIMLDWFTQLETDDPGGDPLTIMQDDDCNTLHHRFPVHTADPDDRVASNFLLQDINWDYRRSANLGYNGYCEENYQPDSLLSACTFGRRIRCTYMNSPCYAAPMSNFGEIINEDCLCSSDIPMGQNGRIGLDGLHAFAPFDICTLIRCSAMGLADDFVAASSAAGAGGPGHNWTASGFGSGDIGEWNIIDCVWTDSCKGPRFLPGTNTRTRRIFIYNSTGTCSNTNAFYLDKSYAGSSTRIDAIVIQKWGVTASVPIDLRSTGIDLRSVQLGEFTTDTEVQFTGEAFAGTLPVVLDDRESAPPEGGDTLSVTGTGADADSNSFSGMTWTEIEGGGNGHRMWTALVGSTAWYLVWSNPSGGHWIICVSGDGTNIFDGNVSTTDPSGVYAAAGTNTGYLTVALT